MSSGAFSTETYGPLELFKSIDKDKSGAITLFELEKGLKEVLMKSDKEIELLFAEADADRSGTITIVEWETVVSKRESSGFDPGVSTR